VNFVFIGITALVVSAAAVCGTLWYVRNRERIAVAVAVIRGRAEIKGGVIGCARPHAEAGSIVLDTPKHEALVRASHELTLALGYIARADKVPYADAVSAVIDKQ
jgi:hypothetical protein